MSVKKHIKFAAPYRSQTFNTLDKLLIGRNGVVSGGEVTTSAGVATIQPLVFVQNGLLVEVDSAVSAVVPAGLQAPYYIVVSVSSSVENLAEVITPTFVKRPQDVSANTVLVAQWDGQEWVPTPRLQINEVLRQLAQRTVKQDFIGIADGFNVNSSGPTLVVDPGSLFDRKGEIFTKTKNLTFLAGAQDVDGWDRIDDIIFRRPDDSAARGGTIQYITGAPFDGSNPYTQIHELSVSADSVPKQAAKTLVDPATNTKYFVWLQDTGARAEVAFSKIVDSNTPAVSATVYLATGGVTDFDVILEPGETSIGLVYTLGNNLYYRKFDTNGSPLSSAITVQAGSAPLLQPRVVSVKSGTGFFLHVVYKEVTSGVVYKLWYARLSSTSTVETTPVVLVNLTDKVTNPSLDKDDDDSALFLVFENQSTGRIYLRQYLADTATSVAAPTQLGATLELADDVFYVNASVLLPVGGSSNPIVKRAANKDLFVFWKQNKGGATYGVGIYGTRVAQTFGRKAVVVDITGGSENISALDVALDPMNTAHLSLLIGANAVKGTLRLEDMRPGVTATIATGSPNQSRIALDSLGAAVNTWAFASSGFSANGSPITPQQYGAGTIGSEPITAAEIVFLQTDVATLPTEPTSGDEIVVSGSVSNDNTYTISSLRQFVDSGITYIAYTCTATFTTEASGGAGQFQAPAASSSQTAKATAGVFDNMRGFYVTPTDIHIAHYRTSDGALSVVGPAIEETHTVSRIYELFNSVLGGSGQISWNVLGAGVLSSATDIKIRFFNRVSEYTISAIPGGISIPDGSIAYVIVPDEDQPATLPLAIVPFGDGILDRFGRRAVPIFWNIGGDLFIRFAPFRLSSDEHTVVIGESISQQLIDFIGAGTSTPDPNAHSYLSTNYILQTDSHENAIGKLDLEVGILAASIASFLAASAVEETQTVGAGGTTLFNCLGFTWSADVSKPDIQVYVNGIKVTQDTTGSLLEDFRKNSASQLEFAYTIPENAKITVRKQSITIQPAQEEELIVSNPLGVTTFTCGSFTWDGSNAIPEIQVFVNGIKQIQDQAGGLNEDYRKTSTNTLQFSYTVPYGAKISVRLERNGSGAAAVTVKDEGSVLTTNLSGIDFVGAGVSATVVGPNQIQVNVPGVGGGAENFQKSVYNNTGVAIPARSVLAWADDGSVQLADANDFTMSDFAGISVNSIPHATYGQAYKGGNVSNCLTGLGAIPGQEVYLSATPGGFTLTPPGGLTDTIFKLGRAEPPDGFFTATANDLYLELEVIATP